MSQTLTISWILAGALLAGCSSASPELVGPLLFPEATSAVSVSSARFFAIDPSATFNNSAMRNCRFGRTGKIPVVSSLVELSLTELKISGQSVGALSGGRLEAEHRTALESHLAPMASVSRSMAASACHPWRSGLEDASMTPSLLIAADSRAPAGSLELIIDVAWKVGFDEAALWIASAGSPAVAQGSGASLTPTGTAVAEIVREIDQIRAGGEPCVIFQPRSLHGIAESGEQTGSPASGAMKEFIPVLPITRSSDRRLVSGEICGNPQEQIPTGEGSEETEGAP